MSIGRVAQAFRRPPDATFEAKVQSSDESAERAMRMSYASAILSPPKRPFKKICGVRTQELRSPHRRLRERRRVYRDFLGHPRSAILSPFLKRDFTHHKLPRRALATNRHSAAFGNNDVRFSAILPGTDVRKTGVFRTLNACQLKGCVCATIGGGLWEGFPNRRQ